MSAAEYVDTRTVPLASLTRYPGNARRGDVPKIRESLRRNGQYRALVVRQIGTDLVILAGNQTHAALTEEGHATARCEVIRCDDDTALRINLGDNRLGEIGGYDDDDLVLLLGGLNGDATGTGWTDDEIAALLAPPDDDHDGDDPDRADRIPDPPAAPRSQTGDLWLLGEHRLLVGDATQLADVARLFRGEQPDMILTDPPYCSGGFQEAGRSAGSIGVRSETETRRVRPTIANDRLSTRGYQALIKAVLGAQPAPIAYLFTDWRMWTSLFDVAESSGYGVRQMIVWDKGSPGMGRGWRSQHELVMLATRATIDWDAHKAQGNVIRSARTGNELHPTQKPVDLLATVLSITDMCATVYDPFGGSGSTLIAAHQVGRVAYLMEVDPAHADTVCRRWQEHTGVHPVHDGTGDSVDFCGPDYDDGSGLATLGNRDRPAGGIDLRNGSGVILSGVTT